MARAAPKSKKRPAPKSKKEVVVENDSDVKTENEDDERERDDSSADDTINNTDEGEQVDDQEDEPPAKKGRGGRKGKGAKKAPAKKNSKSSKVSSKRKSASKKDDDDDDDEEDDKEYEVEKVVGVRIKNKVKQYEIKWKRYPSHQNTWEPEDNLSCDDAIKAFEESQENAKKNPRVVRDNPKTTERYADIVQPSGGKRHSGRKAKFPRKTYREDPDD